MDAYSKSPVYAKIRHFFSLIVYFVTVFFLLNRLLYVLRFIRYFIQQ